MQLVTAAEMRALDRHTIDVLGIPALVLMENAGGKVARALESFFPGKKSSWLLLIGKGNNGGDGLVSARHLTDAGHTVHILYAESPDRLTGEAAIQRDIVARLGIASSVYQAGQIQWEAYDGILDALLGTGTKGAPREPYASLIREANASGLPVIAVDIPSGLDADTGAVSDPCIQAVQTVSLAFLKRGLAQYPGAQAAGSTTVAPIGIPLRLADQFHIDTFLLGDPVFTDRLKVDPQQPRRTDSHKGTYGHTLVVAGTRRMSGAGILCSKGALRTGCGLVTWAVPNSLLESLIGHVPEAMLTGISDAGRGDWSDTSPDAILSLAKDKQAVAIGPGMGQFPNGADFIRTIWAGVECPLVVDADALNMMADSFSSWPKRQASAILTPHPGEMARLAKVSVKELQADRIRFARSFAMEHNVTLVLKGARTVISTPAGAVYVNPTGNPGMATGGTGDVLAGMIVSLLAQGYTAAQAACLGAYLHGRAGDLAAGRRGHAALLAGDLIEEIGK